MHAGRGVSGAIALPVFVGLYIWLSLKAGAIWLPGGLTLTRTETPKRFWSLVGLLTLVPLGFLGLVLFWMVRNTS